MDTIKPEVAIATSVCPHPERWHCYDDMATEVEVLKFLHYLVCMLKPETAIETGCYHGHATEEIAWALAKNDRGRLYTCDKGNNELMESELRVSACLGDLAKVEYRQCSGLELINELPGPIDFAFLDSGPDEVRCHELRALYPKLSPGAVVAIHDSGIQGFLREKYLPPLLRELDMQHIFFDTPRGLTLCRKRPEIYP